MKMYLSTGLLTLALGVGLGLSALAATSTPGNNNTRPKHPHRKKNTNPADIDKKNRATNTQKHKKLTKQRDTLPPRQVKRILQKQLLAPLHVPIFSRALFTRSGRPIIIKQARYRYHLGKTGQHGERHFVLHRRFQKHGKWIGKSKRCARGYITSHGDIYLRRKGASRYQKVQKTLLHRIRAAQYSVGKPIRTRRPLHKALRLKKTR